ncbi:MAG TPA: hypothetical protein PK052_05620 [Anaerohalosphaeraceae bacterium]|nr:hypothetical protein [Phycisphaerae bacterium]HOK94501.1 hypothetical protein [Anaerohalosphaeraceae bacterium]HOL31444.1 hypothetical protein [Anaerohalosphaeraceae bacterium]HOM75314.1 hypothetical protein [Anaerohalosphaeraceae bacterium]HPC63302.1 hypothetical protein [Anaerohalosphaeraceae bacterium]
MVKKSPFEAVYRQLGARFDIFYDWLMPADFGDIEAENNAIKNHCAAVDLSCFGRISVKGGSNKEVLSSIFKYRSGSLALDRWIWAKTTKNGKDLLCRIVRTNGDCIVITSPGQNEMVMELLTVEGGEAISVSDLTEKTGMLGLYGPAAAKSVRGLLPFEFDSLEIGDAAQLTFFMMSFTLLRGSWLGQDGLELVCPASAGAMAAGAIVKYRNKHNITPAGMESLSRIFADVKPPV